MQSPSPIAIHARVQLLYPLETIPALALGIVVRTRLAPDFYEVWFDGESAPCVVRAGELEYISASGLAEAS